jgi:hypothetical protein
VVHGEAPQWRSIRITAKVLPTNLLHGDGMCMNNTFTDPITHTTSQVPQLPGMEC